MIRVSEEMGSSRVASKRKDFFSADQCIFIPQLKCASTRLSVAARLPLLMAARKMQPIDDRGVGLTFQLSHTVIARGTAGTVFVEFWPNISKKLFHRKQ